MNEGKRIFLLRAFGDFIIAVYTASKSRLDIPVTLIASKHLEPLYKAIPVSLPPNISIRFRDFRIKNNIFSCFTNKYIISLNTVKELLALRGFIRENPLPPKAGYMENRRRLFWPRLFAGYSFQYIVSDQNVYKTYADFFCVPFAELEDVSFYQQKRNGKILILPDSRQKEKNISDELIMKILHTCKDRGNMMTVAFFKEKKNIVTDNIIEVYQNFQELIGLINNADIIIGADSMAIHVAQMLGKTHYILRAANKSGQFLTPFSLKHKTHFTFEDIIFRKSFLFNE